MPFVAFVAGLSGLIMQPVPARKAVFASNTAWSLVNFRIGLIRALIADGWTVVAAAPWDEHSTRLVEEGCRFVPLAMDNKGVNPVRDLALLARFFRLLRAESPDVYFGFTIKPNVYGSLAAHALGVPAINNITGLGTVFIKRNWITYVALALYRLALFKSRMVCFENNDDRAMFVNMRLVAPQRADCLPVCGIDLGKFSVSPLPCTAGRPFSFLLVARMLWDKGVGEYVEAARIVRRRHPGVSFGLLGFLNVENRTSISEKQIRAWEEEGVVKYLGASSDVRPFMQNADCVVLPSYREGLSAALREAAAMGRPVIATDTTGCREVVDEGMTGFLVKLRDPADLAEKMERMLRLPCEDLVRMGLKGREKMEASFGDDVLVARYIDLLRQLTRQGLQKRPNEC